MLQMECKGTARLRQAWKKMVEDPFGMSPGANDSEE